jgi:hypothetical protein
LRPDAALGHRVAAEILQSGSSYGRLPPSHVVVAQQAGGAAAGGVAQLFVRVETVDLAGDEAAVPGVQRGIDLAAGRCPRSLSACARMRVYVAATARLVKSAPGFGTWPPGSQTAADGPLAAEQLLHREMACTVRGMSGYPSRA